ncbi:hypothetical protein PV416_23040 [Streptomyces ipomoeae]|uniref:hypothetical protein n=1 Tax=Streptomyces ipomoeae TaxID=103232 RepID=UPI0006932E01|nr:hypothetical protein [Streptomyces ipomoeae]MDX2697448.1 hypothetical protein [Streptomyces ipomoeae]MDX2823893.1 hypothetical protein [Streptomyces ipomoeae]MDX2840739.1 hypothetical protein [Streptomyces ipomoeae]MDX2876515.1 hypothetical protein [Streptomyces ipomoeae]
MHEWLVARSGRDCNHARPGQILHIAFPNGWDGIWNYLAQVYEQHAIKVLSELLDELATEREVAGTHRPQID